MVGLYVKSLWLQAWRQTVSDVLPHSIPQAIARVVVVAATLAAAWGYVQIWDEQSPVLGDTVLAAGLGALAVGTAVITGLILNVLFRAPYQLWMAARAGPGADSTANISSRRADLENALDRLKHLATARELWWSQNHTRNGPGPGMYNRINETTNEIRQFFPPSSDPDPEKDPITQLSWAASRYGNKLGFSAAGRPRTDLDDDWKKLEEHIQAALDRFDRQTDGREQSLRDRRRTLIDQARDAAHAFEPDGVTNSFYTYIEKQRFYADIRKHLSDDFMDSLRKSSRTAIVMPRGSHFDGLQSKFLREIDRLESEWGLDDE